MIVTTTNEQYAQDLLTMINGIFNLSGKEIEVLAIAITYNLEDPFSTEARKHITDRMEFKTVMEVNNYVRSLIKKGVMWRDEVKKIHVHGIIKEVFTKREFVVQFKFNTNDSPVLQS